MKPKTKLTYKRQTSLLHFTILNIYIYFIYNFIIFSNNIQFDFESNFNLINILFISYMANR